MRRFFVITLLLTLLGVARAQEFRCTAQVNYQKLLTTTQAYESSSDKQVFENMKQAIEDFVGGRQWTTLQLKPEEKLEMSVSLILNTRSSQTDFGGQLQIQLKRPVFNSTYTTGLFNYQESGTFYFTYNESQPMDFDINSFQGQLSSTLAYYCYIFLGIYFDSFAPSGGDPFFQIAQQIQQAADGAGEAGWSSGGNSKHRYWFVENHTNGAYSGLHEVYYTYHRRGLDMMTRDQASARKSIISALQTLKDVNSKRTGMVSVQQFMDVKVQEIISIFTPAPEVEQQQVYDLVREISPLNATKMKAFNKKV